MMPATRFIWSRKSSFPKKKPDFLDARLKILIEKCQNNSREAQTQVYEMFSPAMFSVCLRYSNSYEDAQDVFQEGFIVAFQKIEQFRFKGSFEGWLRRIMVNRCIEVHRKRTFMYVVNEEILGEEEAPAMESFEEPEEENYSYEELLSFIRELPERYRQVFNLYVMDGYTHQEISDMLGISIGTSKSNLSRARKNLIDMINKDKILKMVSK